MGVGGDNPDLSLYSEHEVKDKDILVLGSDGLWDNLYDSKVIDLIRPFIRDTDEILDPELVAEVIATEAERLSMQRAYFSPFAKHAKKAYTDFMGGKPDDITVIVA